MSVQTEIDRISGNIASSLDAVANKGVSVPEYANSDSLPGLIEQIKTDGGSGTVRSVDGVLPDEDGNVAVNAVRYDGPQGLTAEQKKAARENLDVWSRNDVSRMLSDRIDIIRMRIDLPSEAFIYSSGSKRYIADIFPHTKYHKILELLQMFKVTDEVDLTVSPIPEQYEEYARCGIRLYDWDGQHHLFTFYATQKPKITLHVNMRFLVFQGGSGQ